MQAEARNHQKPLALGLAALGVVFGDIGTSPLYALRQCFYGNNAIAPSHDNVIGVLSLVFWSLIVVISLKYILVVMKQDNDGEGGIIALVALLRPMSHRRRYARAFLIPLGLFGAALLYGDGTITPAISVMSAVEGMSAIDERWSDWVVPATIVILFALFIFQRNGTERIGQIFGPVMLVWFVVIAMLGIGGIIRNPAVIEALNPVHALAFLLANGLTGYLVLGTVFLVVTGGEALYADLGHFGLGPIRRSWFFLVLPALVLNYFGQGALVLLDPAEAAHPFYHLAPTSLRLGLVLLATIATIIASQAVISATYSLTAQAIQLGMLPRMQIVHTSSDQRGRIYIPLVNWLLMIATISLVASFRTSDGLGAAYGLAVSTDMAITTLLAGVIAFRYRRQKWLVVLTFATFAAVDLAFLGANLFKFIDGGWYPLLVAAVLFVVMTTWRQGQRAVLRKIGKTRASMSDFLQRDEARNAHRVAGTAVFLAPESDEVPPVLAHHLAHQRVLHEHVILLTVVTEDVPRIAASDRIELLEQQQGCYRFTLKYGYMQSPNIPVALRLCEHLGLSVDVDQATYYLGRHTPVPMHRGFGMAAWRESLFAFLERNALRATAFYGIPSERVVEIGMQVEV